MPKLQWLRGLDPQILHVYDRLGSNRQFPTRHSVWWRTSLLLSTPHIMQDCSFTSLMDAMKA